jgi:hypothetical protein
LCGWAKRGLGAAEGRRNSVDENIADQVKATRRSIEEIREMIEELGK